MLLPAASKSFVSHNAGLNRLAIGIALLVVTITSLSNWLIDGNDFEQGELAQLAVSPGSAGTLSEIPLEIAANLPVEVVMAQWSVESVRAGVELSDMQASQTTAGELQAWRLGLRLQGIYPSLKGMLTEVLGRHSELTLVSANWR